jgi:hypothetical protein
VRPTLKFTRREASLIVSKDILVLSTVSQDRWPHSVPVSYVYAKERKNYVEVLLGFGLGIIAIVFGSGFIARTCNLVFPTSPNSPGCQDSASNLYGLVGLVLVPLGALAIVASMVVLIGRKHV